MTLLAGIQGYIDSQKIDKTNAGWKNRLPKPPPDVDFKGVKVTWKLETNVGNIAIRLLPDVAPRHVTSTVYLTRLGFYDDVPFHRVIGRGTGGPGYQYAGEFDPKVKHDKGGLLSMANAGPNTDGSQFFLTFVATPWLDGKHTIFGEVISGMDAVKKLEEKGTQGGQPTAPLKIVKATIEVE